MSKEITFGNDARAKIVEGGRKLAHAVGATLGPFGKNVILKRQYSVPHITKDGVTVARNIRLQNQLEDIGALLIREAASNTADNSGDGTTTTTVMAYEMLLEFKEATGLKFNILDSKNTFKEWQDKIIEFIHQNEITFDDIPTMIKYVSLVSTNKDPELSQIVTDCFSHLGKYAHAIVNDSLSKETHYEIHKGLYLEGGYKSREFITDPVSAKCILHNPFVLVTDYPIYEATEILSITQAIVYQNKSLLIICPEINGEAMTLLNKLAEKHKKFCVIKNPGINIRKLELMEDISAFTGAKVLKEAKGERISDFQSHFSNILGQVDKVEITMDSTLLVGCRPSVKPKLEERLKYLQNKIDTINDVYLRKRYEQRLSTFDSGVGIIYVGANSVPELKEKKDRLDDAICAVRSALDEGVVIGGGYLFNAYAEEHKEELLETNEGAALYKALKSPLHQIWQVNAGSPPPKNYEEYLELNNIYDPIKVLKDCLKNSISVVQSILSTDVVVIDDAESNEILGDLPQFEDVINDKPQQ